MASVKPTGSAEEDFAIAPRRATMSPSKHYREDLSFRSTRNRSHPRTSPQGGGSGSEGTYPEAESNKTKRSQEECRIALDQSHTARGTLTPRYCRPSRDKEKTTSPKVPNLPHCRNHDGKEPKMTIDRYKKVRKKSSSGNRSKSPIKRHWSPWPPVKRSLSPSDRDIKEPFPRENLPNPTRTKELISWIKFHQFTTPSHLAAYINQKERLIWSPLGWEVAILISQFLIVCLNFCFPI